MGGGFGFAPRLLLVDDQLLELFLGALAVGDVRRDAEKLHRLAVCGDAAAP